MLNDWTDYEDEKRRAAMVVYYREASGGLVFWIASTALIMGLLVYSVWPTPPQPVATPSGPPAGITIIQQGPPHER